MFLRYVGGNRSLNKTEKFTELVELPTHIQMDWFPKFVEEEGVSEERVWLDCKQQWCSGWIGRQEGGCNEIYLRP